MSGPHDLVVADARGLRRRAGTTSSTDFAPAVRRLAGDALDRERTA